MINEFDKGMFMAGLMKVQNDVTNDAFVKATNSANQPTVQLVNEFIVEPIVKLKSFLTNETPINLFSELTVQTNSDINTRIHVKPNIEPISNGAMIALVIFTVVILGLTVCGIVYFMKKLKN